MHRVWSHIWLNILPRSEEWVNRTTETKKLKQDNCFGNSFVLLASRNRNVGVKEWRYCNEISPSRQFSSLHESSNVTQRNIQRRALTEIEKESQLFTRSNGREKKESEKWTTWKTVAFISFHVNTCTTNNVYGAVPLLLLFRGVYTLFVYRVDPFTIQWAYIVSSGKAQRAHSRMWKM